MADTVGTGSAAAVKAVVSAVASVEVRAEVSVVGGATVVTENCTLTPLACASERRPFVAAVTLVMAMVDVATLSDNATPAMKAVC